MDVLAGLLAFAFMAVTATAGVLLPLVLRLRRTESVALGLLVAWSAVTWLLVTPDLLEVKVLQAFSSSHGLTVSDLFALGPLAVAGWLVLRSLVRPAGSGSPQWSASPRPRRRRRRRP